MTLEVVPENTPCYNSRAVIYDHRAFIILTTREIFYYAMDFLQTISILGMPGNLGEQSISN